MNAVLLYVLFWVLPSVLIGVAAGFYLGRSAGPSESEAMKQHRALMLKSMLALLKSTEELSADADSHKSELRQAGRMVEDLHLDGELRDLQHLFLGQIRSMLKSNQKLEDDLVCAHYRLENQARELDRTRLEARTDALSGVSNRKAFDETLQFLSADYKRQANEFVLVLADIDHFKWINDTHGHPAGDRVVTQVGQFLSEQLRSGDHVARYGGDEFALFLLQVDAEAALRIADRIRIAVAQRTFDIGHRGERVSITFSMGLTAIGPGDGPETLIARADQALYQSKQGGRNQLHGLNGQRETLKPPADVQEALPEPSLAEAV